MVAWDDDITNVMTGIIPEVFPCVKRTSKVNTPINMAMFWKKRGIHHGVMIVMVFLATAKNCSRLISWKLMDINRIIGMGLMLFV